MKTKLIILLLTACLLTGCGKAEKTETDNIEKNKPFNTINPNIQEDVKKEEKIQIQKTEVSTQLFNKDDCIQFKETDLKIKNKTSKCLLDYSNAPEAIDIGDAEISKVKEIPYDKERNYKKGRTPEQLMRNLKQKKFTAECIKAENVISNEEMVKSKKYVFEAVFDDVVYDNKKTEPYESIEELIDEMKNDTSVYRSYFGLFDFEKNKQYVCSVLSNVHWNTKNGSNHYCVRNEKIAIFEMDINKRFCVIDMEKKEYQIVDFGNMIQNEYGVCKSNKEFNDVGVSFAKDNVVYHEFIDDNTLALVTGTNHLFIYEIDEKCISDCVYFDNDNISDVSINMNSGIINVLRTYENDTAEYYAIKLKNMEVVSYIDFGKSSIIEGDYCCIYKKGITYVVISDGLYVYNPETKICDAVYVQLDEKSDYSMEKIKKLNKEKYEIVDESLCLETEMLFEDDSIYLIRKVWQDWIDYDGENLEIIIKKLTLK